MSARARQRRTLAINARNGAIGTAAQRRRARALWAGLSLGEIARREGVTSSAISQSLSSPAIARALRSISNDCDRRKGRFADWAETRLPVLLERLGLLA